MKSKHIVPCSWLPVLMAMLSVASFTYGQGAFVNTDIFKDGRENSGSAVLADGRVLFVGGTRGYSENTAEIYDPATGIFTPTGSTIYRRGWPSVVALADGRAMVFGGTSSGNSTSDYVYAIEIWDPATGVFSQVGQLPGLHVGGSACQLPNGHILMTTWSSELWVYDTVMRTVKTVPLSQRCGILLQLKNGQFCILGEVDNYNRPTRYIQIFDPATESIVWTGLLNTARSRFATTVLQDGRVLISGGLTDPNPGVINQYTTFNSCEIFDPVTRTVAATYNMIERRYDHWVAQIPDGRVLIGGPETLGTEIFDLTRDTFTPTSTPLINRSCATVTTLRDGRILLTGGRRANSWIAQCELFVPTGWGATPPPVADAGQQQILFAGTATQVLAALDGSASSGNSLSYSWAGPFGTAIGSSPTVTLPLGIHTITLTVTDSLGRSATDVLQVAVVSGSSGDPAEIARLQQQVQQLTAQVDELLADLRDDDALIASLRAENTTLRADRQALENSLSQASAEIARLQGELQAAQTTIQSLRAQVTSLTEQLDATQAALARLQTENGSLRTENQALQASLAQANARIVQLEAQLHASQASLQTMSSQLAAANSQNAALSAANQSLQEQLDQSNARNAELGAQLQTAQTANLELQAQNTSLADRLAAANAQISALTALNGQLAEQNGALTAQIQTLSQLLATAFGNPGFQIPGATLQEQLQNLVNAIDNLNHGQKQALYKNLGGR